MTTSVRPLLALRLAARGLRRDPWTTFLAASILALGLAAPTTFFSILVGAVRPLPVPEGNRVVRVDVVQPSRAGRLVPVETEDLARLQGVPGLEALGASAPFEATLVDSDRAATRASGAALSPEVLPLLRVAPRIGRVPQGADAEVGMLIGWDVWQEVYDGDPGVVGHAVTLNDVPRTITGVMPEGFGFPFQQDLWIIDAVPVDRPDRELVGRLADGGSEEVIEAELTGRWLRGDPERAEQDAGGTVDVRPYTGGRGESGEGVAFLGLVLVGLCLLVIACANVANLLLVRATERIRALGIQAALGAGRPQVAAQLFTESLLVAALGGGAGLWLASLAIRAMQLRLSGHFGYFWMRMAVDGRVVAFISALVVGTAVLAGVVPVIRILRADLHAVLKSEGRGAFLARGSGWGRGFVTLQLALSCAAVSASGLTAKALAGSRDFGSAVPADELVIGTLDVGGPGGGGLDSRAVVLDRLEVELAVRREFAGATLARGAPGYREGWNRIELEGERYDRPEDRPSVGWNAVTPSFFEVVGLDVRAGRGFRETDDRAGAPVAVVNESFSSEHFPGGGALGRQVRVMSRAGPAGRIGSAGSAGSAGAVGVDGVPGVPGGDGLDANIPWRTVVGIVSDAGVGAGNASQEGRVYVPLAQTVGNQIMVIGRAGDVAAGARALRAAVAATDPALPVWDVRTLEDGYAWLLRLPRALAAVALGGGLVGLLVAAVGLYGLLAFRVRARRREMGVRLALGADGRRLAWEVLGAALRQLVPALVLGTTFTWLASPILRVMMLGTDPRAPGTYVVVAAAFVTVGVVAALAPALRASRVEPAVVLRGE